MVVQIALVGLGTVGTSIGLALKNTTAELRIMGHDKDSAATKRALSLKAVDRTDWNLINACEKANLVILSIPLGEIRPTLAALGPVLREGCVVTDTAALKVPVLGWASETLPHTIQFVGGHPILKAHDEPPAAELLAGATYCLTPGVETSDKALETVSNLAEATGARAYYLDAVEHDSLIAALEQLPQLLSLAFRGVLARAPSKAEMRPLQGASQQGMMQLLERGAAQQALSYTLNAGHLMRWLRDMGQELQSLGDLLEQDSGALEDAITVALEASCEKDETAGGEDVRRPGILGRFFVPR